MTDLYKLQSFTFNDDGTCSQNIMWSDQYVETYGEELFQVFGTYVQDEHTVKVVFPTDEYGDINLEFLINGNSLLMDEDDCVSLYVIE